MIYLDSSALLKLLVEEDESAALEAWLREHQEQPKISSELVRVEVVRAARRFGSAVVPDARALIGSLDLIPVRAAVLDPAADLGPSTLRSLDAIHLASALAVRSHVSAFVAYDVRLREAAESAGLATITPR